ncbi:hypothetical protein QFC19_006488 [Naganishia cerealis]|uniref:Uncharacterized protein n=1 Tax=Naganishia cerealis TaxID=610337 RepID=A0ACC2VFZ0_9TREE|nr:hypothetical protein QFC19_006488 [Naganishia cerealis]
MGSMLSGVSSVMEPTDRSDASIEEASSRDGPSIMQGPTYDAFGGTFGSDPFTYESAEYPGEIGSNQEGAAQEVRPADQSERLKSFHACKEQFFKGVTAAPGKEGEHFRDLQRQEHHCGCQNLNPGDPLDSFRLEFVNDGTGKRHIMKELEWTGEGCEDQIPLQDKH